MPRGSAKILNRFYLTFDVEDFISGNSIPGLHYILELLDKYELNGLFFITGNMAEKLSYSPKTVKLLDNHHIGYHSSGHSIHPTIFEFTDLKSFDQAYQSSLVREVSHINPLTGEIEGSGGIQALRALFPHKQILSFRAPGYCLSTPHLMALKSLGICYDFSTTFSSEPFLFRGLSFYPFPIIRTNWQGGIRQHLFLDREILDRPVSVLTIHPSTMVNKTDWDSIYYPQHGSLSLNPAALLEAIPWSPMEVASIFHKFDLLLKHLSALQRVGLLEVTPELKKASKVLSLLPDELAKGYKNNTIWLEGFGYRPRYLHEHFFRFFAANPQIGNVSVC